MKPFTIIAALLITGTISQSGWTQNPLEVVVATVGNEQITLAQVEAQLRGTLGKQKVPKEARPLLEAAAARQLVNQLLVATYLSDSKHAVNEDQVKLRIEQLTNELAKTETKLEDFLKQRGQSMDGLKQQIRWQTSWSLYLKEHLTDKNLKLFFEKHKSEYDGTKVHVAHLILGREPKGKSDSDKLVKRANAIKSMIDQSKLTWEAAVKSHSTSETSRDKAGDIGWIERHKPMPEVFSKAAFGLKVGEVSAPVETKYGVHLIRCLEIKEGTVSLSKVKKQVAAGATKFLFERLVRLQMEKTKPRYTGKCPYFDPDSGKLVK